MTDLPLAHEGYELKYADLQFGAGFPALWAPRGDGLGGPPPDDFGTLHFTVATQNDEIFEDGVTVSVTLRELVEDLVSGCTEDDGLVKGEWATNLAKIAEAMKDAAAWLDSKLEKTPAAGTAKHEA